MRKYVILSLIAVTIFSLSCKNQDTDKKESVEKAKWDYIKEVLSKNEKDEIILLLSMKYGLDIGLVTNIIENFAPDPDEQTFSGLEAKTVEEFDRLREELQLSSYRARINKFSDENGIQESLIAGLLIDYKIWYESSHDEAY